MKTSSTSQLNIELLIITFTIVSVLLGVALIYFFIYILKQKKQKRTLENKLNHLKQDKL